jgi:hypothetical protein
MSRFLFLMLAMAVALSTGCRARVSSPGGAKGSKPEAARKQAEELAVSGVNGAANAQAEVFIAAAVRNGTPIPPRTPPADSISSSSAATPDLPQPRALPRPGAPPIIRERVISEVPAATEADADKEAILAAQDLIERRLAELDPPVRYRPSLYEVQKEFLRRDSRTVTLLRDAKGPRAERVRKTLKEGFDLSPEEIDRRVDVEYDVEITADQVRHLRTRDRVGDTLRVFAALAAVALAGFLFLRADEWTKGYLTHWLAMGAVLFAGGAAAALYFV